MIKAIRKFLGMETFEMPIEPDEFSYLRPIIESHIKGSWSMGKTGADTPIKIQLGGKTVPPLLRQHLEETAEYHGFEIEVRCSDTTTRDEE